jgi:hypothetical protein
MSLMPARMVSPRDRQPISRMLVKTAGRGRDTEAVSATNTAGKHYRQS